MHQTWHHQASLQLRSTEIADVVKELSMMSGILIEMVIQSLSEILPVTITMNPNSTVQQTECHSVAVSRPLKGSFPRVIEVMPPNPNKENMANVRTKGIATAEREDKDRGHAF